VKLTEVGVATRVGLVGQKRKGQVESAGVKHSADGGEGWLGSVAFPAGDLRAGQAETVTELSLGDAGSASRSTYELAGCHSSRLSR
jgi:hypothetical protein